MLDRTARVNYRIFYSSSHKLKASAQNGCPLCALNFDRLLAFPRSRADLNQVRGVDFEVEDFKVTVRVQPTFQPKDWTRLNLTVYETGRMGKMIVDLIIAPLVSITTTRALLLGNLH